MKSKLLTNAFLFSLISMVSLPKSGNSQRDLGKNPVMKDGQFFFYNSSDFQDTISNFKKTRISSPPCPCRLNSSVKKERVVSEGSMVLYITSRDATCGYGSGSIIVQVANGNPPYTFTLTENGFTNPPQNTGNFPVVSSGIKIIKVTDSIGATATATVILKDVFPGPVVIPAFETKTPTNASEADGEVTMYPTGGTPPYTYIMDLIHFQQNNAFSNLLAGVYQLYVKMLMDA